MTAIHIEAKKFAQLCLLSFKKGNLYVFFGKREQIILSILIYTIAYLFRYIWHQDIIFIKSGDLNLALSINKKGLIGNLLVDGIDKSSFSDKKNIFNYLDMLLSSGKFIVNVVDNSQIYFFLRKRKFHVISAAPYKKISNFLYVGIIPHSLHSKDVIRIVTMVNF